MGGGQAPAAGDIESNFSFANMFDVAGQIENPLPRTVEM
jgi:hypothetical protein